MATSADEISFNPVLYGGGFESRVRMISIEESDEEKFTEYLKTKALGYKLNCDEKDLKLIYSEIGQNFTLLEELFDRMVDENLNVHGKFLFIFRNLNKNAKQTQRQNFATKKLS